MKNKKNLWREIVYYRVIIQALLLLTIGLGLMWVSKMEFLKNRPMISDVMGGVGGFLISSIVLAIIWELFNKRAFVDELLQKVNISQSVKDSGMTSVGQSFVDITLWPDWIERANEIELLFSYAGNWRNNHLHRIRERCVIRPMKITVILPDVDNQQTMDELAARFSKSTRERIVSNIREAAEEFRQINGLNGTEVVVLKLSRAPLFSYYRFDSEMLVAFYDHSKEKVPVPYFTFQRRGYAYPFFLGEFGRLKKVASNF